MSTWLNRGRLRRPGRGLKTEEKSATTIQPTASHTEIQTTPLQLRSQLLSTSHTVELPHQ
jgi:hypothetical protein